MRLDGASEHITPYDKLAFSDVQAQALLASGEHRQELTAFFGEREYGELQYLARRAAKSAGARVGRVLIIPGIMGSQLGFDRPAPQPPDLLWVDAVDIGAGRLRALRMDAAAPVRAMGVVLFSYLRLRLHLVASGFDVACVDYDWRLGIEVLGKQLAQRIEAEPHASVHLVAHSMGGLVSRAALSLPARRKVQQVVLLGSPERGLLRRGPGGTRHLSGGAQTRAARCAHQRRRPFRGSVQLLPQSLSPAAHAQPHPAHRPVRCTAMAAEGPRPRARAAARGMGESRRHGASHRTCSVVVGTGQPTVTGIERVDDDFI